MQVKFTATDRAEVIERAERETTFKKYVLGNDKVLMADWVRESFQEVIDRYGLECGDASDWLFKEDELNFIYATLHLDGKWRDGLPIIH